MDNVARDYGRSGNERERQRQRLQIIGQSDLEPKRRDGGAERQKHLEIIGQSGRENQNRTGKENMRRQQMRERKRREQRRKARRRRQLLFLAVQCLFGLAVVLVLANIGMHFKAMESSQGQDAVEEAEVMPHSFALVGSADGIQGGDYIARVGLDEVETPVKREPEEVAEKLGELAENNTLIKEILQNAASYPENMLEALANNPEMADFVTGYLTADGSVTGGLTEIEKQQEHPLFLQWDPRWGYVSYGDDSNVGLAGCGPVSLSMALYYLTGDETLTPDRIASYAMEHGYYMSGTGTQWALMEDVPRLYGLKADKPGISELFMKQELDAGHVLIAAMRQGDFTSAGHFIVIYGYDERGFRVNDPNCVARSKKSWSYETLGGQIKQLWSISR